MVVKGEGASHKMAATTCRPTCWQRQRGFDHVDPLSPHQKWVYPSLLNNNNNNNKQQTTQISATDAGNNAVLAAAISPSYAKVTITAAQTTGTVKALMIDDTYYVTASATATTVSGTVAD